MIPESTVAATRIESAADRSRLLSSGQQQLWVLDQLAAGSPVYNIPFTVRLRGPVDGAVLREAVERITARHEPLRTKFREVDGEPRALVCEPGPADFAELDMSGSADPLAAAQQVGVEQATTRFDLTAGPPLRVRLVRIAAGDYLLCVVMHHIAADGWSLNVFLEELGTEYRAVRAGERSPVPGPAVAYQRYAAQQRAWSDSAAAQPHRDYWRDRLAGAPLWLPLPADRPRPARDTFRGGVATLTIAPEVAERVRTVSRSHRVTPFTLLLAAFDALLARYAGTDDVVVGVPVAGRDRAELEGLVGFFVNVLPVRVRCPGRLTCAELLARVREALLGAQSHAALPTDQIVAEQGPAPGFGRQPFQQVIFQQLTQPPRPRLPGTEAEPVELSVADGRDLARHDLSVTITAGPTGLTGRFVYRTDLFDAPTVERMIEHFQALLAAMVSDPQARVGQVELLSPAERRRLLVDWSGTAAPVPDTGVPELFAAQVARSPRAVAVVCGDQSLSYAELARRVDALADRLRSTGVGPESPVGLLLERGVDAVVAPLAVLRAGGAYLPLRLGDPVARTELVLAEAGASVVVCDAATAARAGRLPVPGCTPTIRRTGRHHRRPGHPSSSPTSSPT